MKPTDAMHKPVVRQWFAHFIEHTEPPKTFSATAVAQSLSHNELKSLGYEKWQEVLPAVIELAFEMRAFGDCVILKGGKLLGEDVSPYEVDGGIRIGRNDG